MLVFGSWEMKPILRWGYVATAILLAGCSNLDWRKDEVLAIPLQPSLQQEVMLALSLIHIYVQKWATVTCWK